MPRDLKLINLLDFTGGLNLRSDGFKLGPSESPDMLNVDVDPRGGFMLRKAALTYGQALSASVDSMWQYEKLGVAKQVMCHSGTAVYYSTGGNWTAVSAITRSGRCEAASFKDKCYVQNGAAVPFSWDGTTGTALGTAANNTLGSGSDGNMPQAKHICAHMGLMWVANTTETSGHALGTPTTAFPNTVRFSHPNFPERWRDVDSIDIDTGTDGDEIVGLVPFGDRLLVFKKRSVHAIYGSEPDNFQVVPLSREVGAAGPGAICATDTGIWFYSWPNGVFRYDGRTFTWEYERLYPSITDGSIPDAYASGIAMGWGNRRLWVSVPWGASTANAKTFVLDPTLGKLGAWVAYDLALDSFVNWRPTDGDNLLIAGATGKSRAVKLDQDATADNFGSGAVHISSHYRTRWLDMGQPAMKKKWKTPVFVLRNGTTGSIPIEVYADYDPGQLLKSFTLAAPTTGTALVWGTGQWGVNTWGSASATSANPIADGHAFGTSHAISVQFNGPSANASWGVDAATLKAIPKPVRH